MYFTSIERGKRKNTANPERSRQTNTEAITYSFLKRKMSIEIHMHQKLHNETFREGMFNVNFSRYTSRKRCIILPTFYIIKVFSWVGSGLLRVEMFSLKDVCSFLETGISGLLHIQLCFLNQAAQWNWGKSWGTL